MKRLLVTLYILLAIIIISLIFAIFNLQHENQYVKEEIIRNREIINQQTEYLADSVPIQVFWEAISSLMADCLTQLHDANH